LIRTTRSVFLTGLTAEMLAWLLAFQGVISNWDFALATTALVVLLPSIGAAVDGGPLSPSVLRDRSPLEFIGIDRPFTTDDVREINRGAGFARERT
jgi:hypothetical protein